MNWDDLRLFLALSRHNSVNATAKTLKVDPTTLLRRIKRLESSLNTRLVELGTNGYHLTGSGEDLIAYIEQAEQSLLLGTQSHLGESSQLSGKLRVSVSEGLGTWILAPALAEFEEKYPEISLELVASSGFLNLNKREADIALLLERPSKGLIYSQKLTDYSLNMYGHKDYLNQAPTIHTIDDLSNHKIISYISDLIYAPQLKFLDEAQLVGKRRLSSSSINAQYQMVAAGAGLSILPRFIAEQNAELETVLPESISFKRTFWQATHSDVRKLARTEAFISWLQSLIASNHSKF